MKEFLWFLLGISPFSFLFGLVRPGKEKWANLLGLAATASILLTGFLSGGFLAGLGIGAAIAASVSLMIAAMLGVRLVYALFSSLGSLSWHYMTKGSLTLEQREKLSRDLGFVLFGYRQQDFLNDSIVSPDGENFRRQQAEALIQQYKHQIQSYNAQQARTKFNKFKDLIKQLGFDIVDDEQYRLTSLPLNPNNYRPEIIELYKLYISYKFSTPPHINPRALWSEIIVPLIILGFTAMAAFALYGGSNWGLTGVGGLAAPGQILMTGILSAHPVSVLVFAGLALAFITQWIIQKFKFSPPDDSPSKAIELSVEALKILEKAEEKELLPHELDALVSYCQQLDDLREAGVIAISENVYKTPDLKTRLTALKTEIGLINPNPKFKQYHSKLLKEARVILFLALNEFYEADQDRQGETYQRLQRAYKCFNRAASLNSHSRHKNKKEVIDVNLLYQVEEHFTKQQKDAQGRNYTVFKNIDEIENGGNWNAQQQAIQDEFKKKHRINPYTYWFLSATHHKNVDLDLGKIGAIDEIWLRDNEKREALKLYIDGFCPKTVDADLRNSHIGKKANAWTLVLSVSALAVATGLVYAVIGGIYVTMGALSWVLPLAALSGFISLASAKKFLASTSGGPYTELALITGAGCTVLLSLVFATLILSWPSTGLVLALGSPAVLTWLLATLIPSGVIMLLAGVRSWMYAHASPKNRKNESKGYYYLAKGLLIVIKLGMLAGSLLLGYIGMGGLFNFDAGFLGIQGGLTQYIFGIGTALVPNNFVLVYNMLSIFSVVTIAVALALAVLTFRSLMRDFQPKNEEQYKRWKPWLDLLNLVFKLGLTIGLVVALWVLLPGLGGIFATSTGLLPVMFVVAFVLPLFTGNIKFLSSVDQMMDGFRKQASDTQTSLLLDSSSIQDQPNTKQDSWMVKFEKLWNKYLGVEPFYKGNDNDFITQRFYKYAIREVVVSGVLLLLPAIILISVVTVVAPESFVFYAAAFYLSGACMSVLFRLQRVLPEVMRKNVPVIQEDSQPSLQPTFTQGWSYDPNAAPTPVGRRVLINLNPLSQQRLQDSEQQTSENQQQQQVNSSINSSAPISIAPLHHADIFPPSNFSSTDSQTSSHNSPSNHKNLENGRQQQQRKNDIGSSDGEMFQFKLNNSNDNLPPQNPSAEEGSDSDIEQDAAVVLEELKASWLEKINQCKLLQYEKAITQFKDWYSPLPKDHKKALLAWIKYLEEDELYENLPWEKSQHKEIELRRIEQFMNDLEVDETYSNSSSEDDEEDLEEQENEQKGTQEEQEEQEEENLNEQDQEYENQSEEREEEEEYEEEVNEEDEEEQQYLEREKQVGKQVERGEEQEYQYVHEKGEQVEDEEEHEQQQQEELEEASEEKYEVEQKQEEKVEEEEQEQPEEEEGDQKEQEGENLNEQEEGREAQARTELLQGLTATLEALEEKDPFKIIRISREWYQEVEKLQTLHNEITWPDKQASQQAVREKKQEFQEKSQLLADAINSFKSLIYTQKERSELILRLQTALTQVEETNGRNQKLDEEWKSLESLHDELIKLDKPEQANEQSKEEIQTKKENFQQQSKLFAYKINSLLQLWKNINLLPGKKNTMAEQRMLQKIQQKIKEMDELLEKLATLGVTLPQEIEREDRQRPIAYTLDLSLLGDLEKLKQYTALVEEIKKELTRDSNGFLNIIVVTTNNIGKEIETIKEVEGIELEQLEQSKRTIFQQMVWLDENLVPFHQSVARLVNSPCLKDLASEKNKLKQEIQEKAQKTNQLFQKPDEVEELFEKLSLYFSNFSAQVLSENTMSLYNTLKGRKALNQKQQGLDTLNLQELKELNTGLEQLKEDQSVFDNIETRVQEIKALCKFWTPYWEELGWIANSALIAAIDAPPITKIETILTNTESCLKPLKMKEQYLIKNGQWEKVQIVLQVIKKIRDEKGKLEAFSQYKSITGQPDKGPLKESEEKIQHTSSEIFELKQCIMQQIFWLNGQIEKLKQMDAASNEEVNVTKNAISVLIANSHTDYITDQNSVVVPEVTGTMSAINIVHDYSPVAQDFIVAPPISHSQSAPVFTSPLEVSAQPSKSVEGQLPEVQRIQMPSSKIENYKSPPVLNSKDIKKQLEAMRKQLKSLGVEIPKKKEDGFQCIALGGELQAVQSEASAEKHCISIEELRTLLLVNDKIQGIEDDIKALENKINQAVQNTKGVGLKLFQKVKSPVSDNDAESLAQKKVKLQKLLNWMSEQLKTLDRKLNDLAPKVRFKQEEQKDVLLKNIEQVKKDIEEEKESIEEQVSSVERNCVIDKNRIGATRPDIKQAIQTFEKEISQILETMESCIKEANEILQHAGLIIESATEPTMAYHTLKKLCQELAKNEQELKTKINAVYAKKRVLWIEKEQLEGRIVEVGQKRNISQYVKEMRQSAIKELSLAELAACVELLSPNENVDDIWKSENREKILCGKLENCTVLSRQYNKKDYSWEGYLLQKDDIIKYMCHFHFDKWGQKLQEWEEKLNPNQPSATPQKTQPQAVSAQTSVLTSSTSTFSPLGLFGLFPASSSPKNKPSSTSSLPLSNKGDELPTSPTK